MKKVISFNAMCLAVLGLVVACGGDAGKGPESPMPIEGSADSWQSPSNHGPVLFDQDNGAEFKQGSYFHAWTWVLEKPADISVWIEPVADNLDTVLYMYRRDPGATSWGPYIARNDDYQDNLWSRLDESLEAGEYRVMVKCYKQSMKGRFALKATCSGAGCAATEECGEDDMAQWPKDTGPAPSCVAKTMKVLTSKEVSSNSFSSTQHERCGLESVARKAWEYYYKYWNDMTGLSDYFDDEEIYFDVELTRLEEGWLVGMDMDGDEDYIQFLFDKKGNLLLWHLSNQSPEVGWYCGDQDEAVDSGLAPDEDCVGDYLQNMTQRDNPNHTSGTVKVATAHEMLPKLGHVAVQKYQEVTGIADDATVSYAYYAWTGADRGELMEITLSAEGQAEVTYTLGDDSYWQFLYFSSNADGDVFNCERLRYE